MKDDRMRWKQNERLEYMEITVSRHVKRVEMKRFSGIVLCVAGLRDAMVDCIDFYPKIF